jgi:hypothetical protein
VSGVQVATPVGTSITPSTPPIHGLLFELIALEVITLELIGDWEVVVLGVVALDVIALELIGD